MTAKDIITIVLSSLALLVSSITFVVNREMSEHNQMTARKPVLVFEYEGKVGWVLRNVGGGPALNVLVAQKRADGKWFNPVRVPPLSREGIFPLPWLAHVNSTGLGATYSDTEELPYTSTCEEDLSKAFQGTLFGPWQEQSIHKHWRVATYRN